MAFESLSGVLQIKQKYHEYQYFSLENSLAKVFCLCDTDIPVVFQSRRRRFQPRGAQNQIQGYFQWNKFSREIYFSNKLSRRGHQDMYWNQLVLLICSYLQRNVIFRKVAYLLLHSYILKTFFNFQEHLFLVVSENTRPNGKSHFPKACKSYNV